MRAAASSADRSAGEAFWRFSLALYARPGAAPALIALQDRAGRDANLILFALWLGATQGRETNAGALAQAAAETAPLSAVAAQARALRRALKPAAEPALQALRRRVLGLELAAERRVQYRLAAGHPEPQRRGAGAAERLAAAEANLALYLGDEAASAEAGVLRRAVAALLRLPRP